MTKHDRHTENQPSAERWLGVQMETDDNGPEADRPELAVDGGPGIAGRPRPPTWNKGQMAITHGEPQPHISPMEMADSESGPTGRRANPGGGRQWAPVDHGVEGPDTTQATGAGATAGVDAGFERLRDTPFELAEGEADLRHRDVFDVDGDRLGTVESLFVDRAERRVRFLEVTEGGILGIGGRTVVVPVEAISGFDDRGVRLDRSKHRVATAPAYDPRLAHRRSYWEDVYRWYGYAPYWAPPGIVPP